MATECYAEWKFTELIAAALERRVRVRAAMLDLHIA
jgi:lysyl-tRNA synthetase class I